MAYGYVIGIGICLLLLIIIAVWLFLRWRKKKKQLLNNPLLNIPQQIINDFEEAERRIKEEGSNKTPYQIMWEMAREKSMETKFQQNLNSTEPLFKEEPKQEIVKKKNKIQWCEFK